MPELPEVESTVRYLRERVVGRVITEAYVSWKRSAVSYTHATFEDSIRGFSIDTVFRRGKFIGLSSSSCSRVLLVHLRMSGSLDVVSQNAEPSRHDRVVLLLHDNTTIRFNDTRKFGRMYLCNNREEVLGNLGIEPLSSEFTAEHLQELLRAKSGRVKPLLLDQRIIAGLGNIYVDECLWKARIHPRTPACSISWPKIRVLHTAITETLEEAIELLGTDFGDGVVEGGMYSPLVYGRTDEQCTRCNSRIKRILVAQRGSHICPRCQRL